MTTEAQIREHMRIAAKPYVDSLLDDIKSEDGATVTSMAEKTAAIAAAVAIMTTALVDLHRAADALEGIAKHISHPLLVVVPDGTPLAAGAVNYGVGDKT